MITDVTRILNAIEQGDEKATDILLPLVYEKLTKKDKVKAYLVKLRYFAGLTGKQAAKVLGISHSTADEHWAYVRAWLRLEITKGD